MCDLVNVKPGDKVLLKGTFGDKYESTVLAVVEDRFITIDGFEFIFPEDSSAVTLVPGSQRFIYTDEINPLALEIAKEIGFNFDEYPNLII